MSFLCRIGWHRSERAADPKDEWAVRCARCGRKGSWSLMSGHTTWEPRPSYFWAWLRWFWDPQTNPHPDPEIQAELDGEERAHRALYARVKEHEERAQAHEEKAKGHQVNATVHKAKMLAYNEYARAKALDFRRKGIDVEVPPSMIGRIDED